MYDKMKNKGKMSIRESIRDAYLAATVGGLVVSAIIFSPLVDDLIKLIEEAQLENKLENDYEIVDYNFQTSEEIIEFTGYKSYPCTNYLRTNVKDVNFTHYSTFLFSDNWETIGYKYNRKLYIAKYIKEYASKDEVMKYISTCDNELSEKQTIIKHNKQTWGE